MRVKIVRAFRGWQPGEIVNVSPDLARAWIEAEYAVLDDPDPPMSAMLEPPENAMLPPAQPRRPRGR